MMSFMIDLRPPPLTTLPPTQELLHRRINISPTLTTINEIGRYMA